MYKGVLFDMDGVIFDTERLYMKIEQQVASDMGYTFPEEEIYKMIGTNYNKCREITLNALGQDFDYETYLSKVKEYAFEEMRKNGIPVKKGVLNLLNYLILNNYKIAIASSSPLESIKHYLELASLEKYFNSIVAGDMVEASKPKPDIFIAAAKSLSLKPEECIAIEDSFNGIKSAHAAGCYTIMVPDLLQPDNELKKLLSAQFDDLDQVISFLEEHKD